MEPDDMFKARSLQEELAAHPEVDAWFDRLVARSVERGERPAWKLVKQYLVNAGLEVGVTENPIKRVYRARGGWDA